MDTAEDNHQPLTLDFPTVVCPHCKREWTMLEVDSGRGYKSVKTSEIRFCGFCGVRFVQGEIDE